MAGEIEIAKSFVIVGKDPNVPKRYFDFDPTFHHYQYRKEGEDDLKNVGIIAFFDPVAQKDALLELTHLTAQHQDNIRILQSPYYSRRKAILFSYEDIVTTDYPFYIQAGAKEFPARIIPKVGDVAIGLTRRGERKITQNIYLNHTVQEISQERAQTRIVGTLNN